MVAGVRPRHHAEIVVVRREDSADSGQREEESHQRVAHRRTVLAGHSGVGKSSLINAIQPALDLRIGAVSEMTEKGRHTTTSANSGS